jgi:hypothetical protein
MAMPEALKKKFVSMAKKSATSDSAEEDSADSADDGMSSSEDPGTESFGGAKPKVSALLAWAKKKKAAAK